VNTRYTYKFKAVRLQLKFEFNVFNVFMYLKSVQPYFAFEWPMITNKTLNTIVLFICHIA